MKTPKLFFDTIKPILFKKGFDQDQVDGINAIIAACVKAHITDLRWIAYMLATVYHECAATMKPISEYGKGKGQRYGQKQKNSKVMYVVPDQLYYGRGYVMLTWYENYQLMGRLLGIDLLNNPELAKDPEIAAKIMIEGMTKGSSSFGDFTGKCLEMYFNDEKTDWIWARSIINGKRKGETLPDCAELIAGYAKTFYSGLQKAA